jgi:hypothetical protein
MSKMNSYSAMSDRELLLVVIERQENQIEQHKDLSFKVNKIEEKILEDIENRIRNLENETNERRGIYKLWMFIIGMLSAISIIISISTKIS